MADLFILIPEADGLEPLFAWRSGGDWQTDTVCPSGRGRGETSVAFVPATRVTLHRRDLASRKPAEARRMALFALEDDLAQPVETLHPALGSVGEGQGRDVHIASVDDMHRWTEWLAELGLPDADLVAPQTCLLSPGMAYEGHEHILFRDDASSFAVDADAPEDLVKSIAPDGLRQVYGERLARLLGQSPAGPGATDAPAYLVQLADWYRSGEAGALVSLRQGDFSVRRQFKLDGLSRWRPIAAVAAAAAILWLGSVWMETRALNNQAQALRVQTNELVAAVSPESNGQVSTAMNSLRQTQQQAAGGLRPTQASAALYEAIAPVADAEIRSLRYDAGNGRLTAMVVFDSYGEADAIGERLEEAGLSVTLGQARQTGNRVMGEFSIEARS